MKVGDAPTTHVKAHNINIYNADVKCGIFPFEPTINFILLWCYKL